MSSRPERVYKFTSYR